jgi:hypothetical protein
MSAQKKGCQSGGKKNNIRQDLKLLFKKRVTISGPQTVLHTADTFPTHKFHFYRILEAAVLWTEEKYEVIIIVQHIHKTDTASSKLFMKPSVQQWLKNATQINYSHTDVWFPN